MIEGPPKTPKMTTEPIDVNPIQRNQAAGGSARQIRIQGIQLFEAKRGELTHKFTPREDENEEEYSNYDIDPGYCSCGQETTDTGMIRCTECEEYDHNQCAHTESRNNYICQSCREQDQEDADEPTTDETHYLIKQITDFGYSRDRMRYFFVIWAIDGSEGCLKEDELKLSSQMVHEFCNKHKLRRSFLPIVLGFQQTMPTNYNNWKTIDEALIKANRYNKETDMGIIESLPKHTINFIAIAQHVNVIVLECARFMRSDPEFHAHLPF